MVDGGYTHAHTHSAHLDPLIPPPWWHIILMRVLKRETSSTRVTDCTYIFISHDLALVKIISDRIIVLKDGNMVDENATNNLFKNPKNYTKKLIDAII